MSAEGRRSTCRKTGQRVRRSQSRNETRCCGTECPRRVMSNEVFRLQNTLKTHNVLIIGFKCARFKKQHRVELQ